MDSRKRSHSHEDDPPTTKKRILTGSNGSPHVNGVVAEQEEPAEGDNLELFRKEAIFRRMRHYSREHERSQSRIAELERRKNTCEAGLAAMSACWSQLVEAIRLLVKQDDIPPVDVNTQELFDLTTQIQDGSTQDLATALEDTVQVTRILVTKFVQLGGGSPSGLVQGNGYIDCQKAQTECAALRSQIGLMRARLKDSEEQKEKYHLALISAETRVDRLRSSTVLAMQSRVATDTHEMKSEDEPQRKPPSPAHTLSPIHGNGITDSLDLEIMRELVKTREATIVQLEHEATQLRHDKTVLELQAKSASQEQLSENAHYKVLLEHASLLEHNVSETRDQARRLADELSHLQLCRREWEEHQNPAATQAIMELKAMLAKRDTENTRLREQREQQAAELNERKHKDSVKIASFQEMKALADSRSERIVVLESALSRHKAQLAANASNEDLMSFFFSGGHLENTQYIDSLKDRVTAAENRAAALEQTLSIFQDDNPNVVEHMKAEADALEKLSEVRSQLEKYQAVYGDPSTLPPDISVLARQLQQKEEEIKRLRLLENYHNQAETSLYAELDKLSAAWETLDRQVKSKVFDLSSMEDRLAKSGLDRAKSENKFYAAMRDKEAIETERKNIVRNLEKQAKAVERLVETERNLGAQVSDLEKELVSCKRLNEVLKERFAFHEAESNEWKGRAEAERKRTSECFVLFNERERSWDLKKAELRKAEDGLIRTKKDLERQMAKLKESAASPSGAQKQSEAEVEYDKLMSILKCSTCKLHFRNTVITKCMHTFCKQCVDARISTRQRKCPACNLPFSQSDVLSLYFQ